MTPDNDRVMMSAHLRCFGAATALAVAATFIPAIAAAMTLLGVLGLLGAAGFVFREWFGIEPQDADTPIALQPKSGVPAHWM